MKFHSVSCVKGVLNAMDYVTYVHNVQQIILDNLHFMLNRNNTNYYSTFDIFDEQDVLIKQFC